MCNEPIENKYHFFLECSQYKSKRELYIPKYYRSCPSYFEFKEFLTKKNTIVLLNICKFVDGALKQRERCL